MTTAELSPADFDLIRGLVRRQSAIVLEQDKHYLIETRLQMLAKTDGFPSVDHLMAEVRAGKRHARVVEAMTTNETSFFRDLLPFEAFRKLVLPELMNNRAGQPPVANLVRRLLHGTGTVQPCHAATRTRSQLEGLEVAITGQRPVHERAGARKARHLQPVGGQSRTARPAVAQVLPQGRRQWLLKDEIRQLVQFQQLNLIGPWPALPDMDVVFLRNVLIYFDVDVKRQILARVRRLLRPDGFLFLGGAETTLNLDDAFERVPFERSGCYRLRSGG